MAPRPEIRDGSRSARSIRQRTALYFRREILRPFLDQYLKDGAPKADVAPVYGVRDRDERLAATARWPSGCASGCTVKPTPLYLRPA